MKFTFATTLAAALLATTASTAVAQEKLRMGTFLPATHFGVTEGSNIFIEELEKRVGDKVELEFYPGQQAGKAREALELVKVGAIDMYELGTGYFSSSDVPLWGLLEVPNMVQSVCDGTRALRALGEPGEVIWQSQYEPLGIRILSNYVYPPYGPAGSRKEINSVDDLKGMKLRNAGGLMERTAQAVGGVPVALTSGEVLQSLQRGTLDSYLGAYSSVQSYEYNRYAPYGVTGFGMGTPGIALAINESKFQSLPEDVQTALIEAGKAAEENFCNYADNAEKEAIENLQGGEHPMTIHVWSDAEVAQLTEMTADVVSNWVADLESRSIPGQAALDAFSAEVNN